MTIRTEQRYSRPSLASRVGGLARHIERALARSREAISRGRRRRSAIRDLRSLSDRELRDIGIERHQIVEVVDGLLAREASTRATASTDAEVRRAGFRTAPHCHA